MKRLLRGSVLARFWPMLLPVLLFLPGLNGFPYPDADARFSDITLAHFPYTEYARQAVLGEGRLPLWSPLFFSGSPFAANPLSGLHYPPGWLAWVLPLPLGFNLLVILHLLWGGAGVYRLLRLEKLSHFPALLGGLAFIALPKFFAHYGAGHLTLLYAVPWTPWLLWAGRSSDVEQPPRRFRFLFTLEAPILAIIFLADPRWSPFAALLWWGYRLVGPFAFSGSRRADWLSRLAALLMQTLLAGLLAAPLALPLAEFTRQSTRLTLEAQDILAFSLPWGRTLGLLIPDFNGFHEWMLYAGQGILLLALLALVLKKNGGAVWFWLAVFTVSLGFGWGENLPLARLAADLPLMDLLRVPARALFLTGFALIMLAAHALQALLDEVDDRRVRRARLALVGYCGFLWALVAGVWAAGGELPVRFVWAALLGSLLAAWIGVRLSGRIGGRIWLAVFLGVCLIDWLALDSTLFAARPPERALSENSALAAHLKGLQTREGMFRVYSPSYSIPGQIAALYGLQLADGVDPLHLQSYAEFMDAATGVPRSGYSVTLPPFEQADPARDNAGYLPSAELLGLLNVRFVAAEFDLAAEGLVYEGRSGETRLYRNLLARPRVWIQPEGAESQAGEPSAEIREWSPERIQLDATGPGLLILSEIAYPGWQVWVDGAQAPLLVSDQLLRAVRLSPGEHAVSFEFHPASVAAGWGIGLLFWMLWGFGALYRWKIRE